ncbi:MAG TPA: serine/threonine-protein kinase, partial [Myxococcaceae bacterium]|nr:serine/threonine-protein kinase [Myxococcaceae bacterium]
RGGRFLQQLGKYQLIRKLATGGMAEVFLARVAGPMGFQKKLVVKRILPQFAQDPQFIDMFLAEAKIAAELNHPNVVQIFDFGKEADTYYIAMELIDGPNLRVLSKRYRQRGMDLPVHLCAKIISGACEGLAYAHDFRDPETGRPVNLIHRDISPDNIILSRNGTVKVVDFGIAKASTQPHLTKSGVVKGKMAYMPPEQLGRALMDKRVDVFALGVVLYEILSGQMPFDATSEVSIIQALMSPEPLQPLVEKRSDVPPELQRIVHKALEKRPADRYPSCRELQADLEAFLVQNATPVQSRELADLVTALDDTAVVQPLELKATPGAGVPTRPPPPVPDSRDPWPEHAESRPPVPGAPDDEYAVVDTFIRRDPEDSVPTAPQDRGSTSKDLQAVRRSKGPIVGALAAVGVIAFAVTFFMLGRASPPSAPPAPVATPSQGSAPPQPPPTAPSVAPSQAPAAPVAAVAPQANPVTPEPEAAPEKAPEAAPEKAPEAPPDEPVAARPAPIKSSSKGSGRGTVTFRIRPYAQVYLDGKLLGETPLEPVTVAAGKHTVRLVNSKLGKDLEFPLVVRSNQETVFKQNLKE